MDREASSSPRAATVQVTTDSLVIGLADGRDVKVPLEWFPRLARGEPQALRNWELVGSGEAIRWPDLEENIRVESLLGGRRWATDDDERSAADQRGG